MCRPVVRKNAKQKADISARRRHGVNISYTSHVRSHVNAEVGLSIDCDLSINLLFV